MSIGNRGRVRRKERKLSDRQDSGFMDQNAQVNENSAVDDKPLDIESPSVLEPTFVQDKRSVQERPNNWNEGARNHSRVSGREELHPQTRSNGTAVLIGLVLDATYSITKVYPAIYVVLKEFLERMRTKSREYSGITFLYSLTVLHDKPSLLMFSDGPFTRSSIEIENALRNLEFYGGSEDGREDLNAAVKMQLSALNMYDHASKGYVKAYHGLLLFTDSMPKDGEERPNFSGDVWEEGIANHGLRFAQFYSYDGEYFPTMRMVDRDGEKSQEQKNFASYGDIKDFLEGGREEAVKQIDGIVKTILDQTSIGM